MRLLIPVALLAISGCAAFTDGAAEGRRGMELFEAGDFEGATAAFQEGIEATAESESSPTREALFTDLGLAHVAQSQYAEAAEAFAEAIVLAETSSRRAQAAFNAGTALAHTEELEQALAFLRRALIARPDFPEARFNFELVKRRLEGSQPEGGTPPEPSAFAEELKARADSLIAKHQYRDAATLMNEGLLQDSTVAAFGDFIERLGQVAEIDEMDAPSSVDSTL